MANPFVQHETYESELVDPRDGERWTATLRVLNAGDRAVLQDETVLESDDSGGERLRVPMGRLRLLTVERALVSWTLPLPASRAAIEVLHEDVFDQLFAACRFSTTADAEAGPTVPQTDEPSPAPSGAGDC